MKVVTQLTPDSLTELQVITTFNQTPNEMETCCMYFTLYVLGELLTGFSLTVLVITINKFLTLILK